VKVVAKLLFAIAALFLFVLALQFTKHGAGGIALVMREVLQVTNAADGMGFGWLVSQAVLSGSPVAASAVALLSADILLSVDWPVIVVGHGQTPRGEESS